MNSSDDELPDIPGTRFPWMKDPDDNEAGPSNISKRYVLLCLSKLTFTVSIILGRMFNQQVQASHPKEFQQLKRISPSTRVQRRRCCSNFPQVMMMTLWIRGED